MPLRPWFSLTVLAAGCAAGAACASSSPARESPEITVVRHVDRIADATGPVALAGQRCGGAESCRCRQAGDDAEGQPPADGKKRFEIRLSADGGEAEIALGALGRLRAAGPQEVCFYVDLPAGSRHDVRFVSSAAAAREGYTPRLRVAEYGPRGPWWYDVIDVECTGAQGRCDRNAIDAWVARTAVQRKRGRLEPCGSAVVSGLAWETAGAEAQRDSGYFRDLSVGFAMEVKKFETQFAPGSTECVPK